MDHDSQIDYETLNRVLSKMFGKKIIRTGFQTKELQGGTLGDVRLVSGEAETAGGEKIPYKVVQKKQKKWQRPGDPDSWRREYDLSMSLPDSVFTDALRRPECYHAALNTGENGTELWLEYIEGLSGGFLTVGMLEQAALELGRFQGRSKDSECIRNIKYLGDSGFMEREFAQWHTQTYTYNFLVSDACRMPEFLKQMLKSGDISLTDGKSFEYGCLRSKACDLPDHLKRMLTETDDRQNEIFDDLKNLPVVLCHRDFWNENIFYSDGKIKLIDWDTAGWGFIGEDIASLIADGMSVDRFEENLRVLIPAYLKGLSEYMDAAVGEKQILTMILIKFGYRMMQEYMFSPDPEEKNRGADALQKIYGLIMNCS